MKKKVALFANGWSSEYLETVMEGIRKRASEDNVDLFAFINFSSGDENKPDNIGERSIFKLPDISGFDGVILLTNTINLAVEREYLSKEIMKYNIPAVSLEYELEGIPVLGTDTCKGISELVNHVIEEHHAKKFLFVTGPVDNSENKLRMQAATDALRKAGIAFSEECTFDAGWSYYAAYEKTVQWVNEHADLPDAIICINDEMAIGVCAALDFKGVKVPEQVIVTGCDHIGMGQDFFPILSTVVREWDKLGYEGMDFLLKRMAGREVPMKTMFGSAAHIGESCGCAVDDARKEQRLLSIVSSYRDRRRGNMNEWHFRYLDEMLMKTTSVDEIKIHMQRNFEYDHVFEGADFMISLVENFFLDETERGGLTPGEFTPNMEVYVNLSGGKVVPGNLFPAKKLLPFYLEDLEHSHIYTFLPLHMGDTVIGYVMQKDNLGRVYEQTMYTWMRHISQDLERARQNIRLEELNKKLTEVSMTDALTGLRNRMGFDVLAMPDLQRCQREGKNSAIVFADVNRMKVINDRYGHLQGDLALRVVAEAIKHTLPKDWIAVRYGGDEFIMTGECKDAEEAESIKECLAVTLEELKKSKELIFPLTVSFGAVIIEPGENYSIEEYMRKADEAMYETKQKYHAKEA